MPRRRKRLPPGARAHILECAESGSLAETKVARALGMGYSTWKRIIRENDDAAALWDEALAIQRDRLYESLFDAAREGDIRAARLLLGARHGIHEQGGSDGGSGPRVTINLPGSVSPKEYERLVSQQPEALDGGRS